MRNEAQTRFELIDPMLIDHCGWRREDIKLEQTAAKDTGGPPDAQITFCFVRFLMGRCPFPSPSLNIQACDE